MSWKQAFLALIHLVGRSRSSCSFILYRESDDGVLTLLMKDFTCVMSLSVEGNTVDWKQMVSLEKIHNMFVYQVSRLWSMTVPRRIVLTLVKKVLYKFGCFLKRKSLVVFKFLDLVTLLFYWVALGRFCRIWQDWLN